MKYSLVVLLTVSLASYLPMTAWAQHERAYSFTGPTGANPEGGLAADTVGNLFGTTFNGGDDNSGAVFEISPPPQAGGKWSKVLLYSFTGGQDGWNPVGDLVLDQMNNLYGVTFGNAPVNCGVVFQLSPPLQRGGSWKQTVLHTFGGPGDGCETLAGLLLDQAGNLYGTTFNGGSDGDGTVFQLTPLSGGGWVENVLYSFSDGVDGGHPMSNLVIDGAGNLYGTTAGGGLYNNKGTIFELSPPSSPGGVWTETVLHSFHRVDGANPWAGVVFGPSGALFGTAFVGGTANLGTAFRLSLPAMPGGAWRLTVLHDFAGTDGSKPIAGLTVGNNGGALYGTTSAGGANGEGTVFQITNSDGSSTESVLYSFTGGSDGAQPYGGVQFQNSALYGTTNLGGTQNLGTIFRLLK